MVRGKARKFGVGLVGFGTVGQGVAALLRDAESPATAKTSAQLQLRRICDVDPDRPSLLAQVSGAFNAISVYGHATGETLYYGMGAGRMPTASAVVADLVAGLLQNCSYQVCL